MKTQSSRPAKASGEQPAETNETLVIALQDELDAAWAVLARDGARMAAVAAHARAVIAQKHAVNTAPAPDAPPAAWRVADLLGAWRCWAARELLRPGAERTAYAAHAAAARGLCARLVARNDGMLVREVMRARPCSDVERDDWLQEARLGLLRALERFEVGRGLLLTTFIGIHARAAIGRARVEGRKQLSTPIRIEQWREALSRGEARATAAGQPAEAAAGLANLTAERAAFARRHPRARVLFLDSPHRFRNGQVTEDASPYEFLPDARVAPSDEQVDLAERRARVRAVLMRAAARDPRGVGVVMRHFGIEPAGPEELAAYRLSRGSAHVLPAVARDDDRNLSQIGRALGVSRERARQLQARLLPALRAQLEPVGR